jgi:ribosomal protein L11 methyltransferase
VPYRADICHVPADSLDRLVELGALDVESSGVESLAVLLPDSVTPDQVARALRLHADAISVSPALARDAGSVWVLSPRPMRVGRLRIVPAHTDAAPDTLRLLDREAFGTGLHPTTALCLEALDEAVRVARPDTVLDVGTGSGILGLAALMMGVPRALGIDIEEDALAVAAENARINALGDRLQLMQGGPETVTGTWPLVLANVLAGPLIEMAPALVRRIGHQGELVLSGIPVSLEAEVDRVYRDLGMRRVGGNARAGWVALVLTASW